MVKKGYDEIRKKALQYKAFLLYHPTDLYNSPYVSSQKKHPPVTASAEVSFWRSILYDPRKVARRRTGIELPPQDWDNASWCV